MARAWAVVGVGERGRVELGGVLLLLPGSFQWRWRDELPAGLRGIGDLRRAWQGGGRVRAWRRWGNGFGSRAGREESSERGSVACSGPGGDHRTVAELRRGAAPSSALGALRGSVGVRKRVRSGVREGVVREAPFIGGGRASGGAGRWRRPTTARGLASP
jgi:hypothetical protein